MSTLRYLASRGGVERSETEGLKLDEISLPQSRHKVVPAPPEEEPIITFAASVSLRLDHATALTVHRTVIHYRVDTSLPYRGAE